MADDNTVVESPFIVAYALTAKDVIIIHQCGFTTHSVIIGRLANSRRSNTTS